MALGVLLASAKQRNTITELQTDAGFDNYTEQAITETPPHKLSTEFLKKGIYPGSDSHNLGLALQRSVDFFDKYLKSKQVE